MLPFTISRMSSLKSIQLLICMLVFLISRCKGFEDPCKSKDRNILQLCEQALVINSTNWYTNLKIYDVEKEIQKSIEQIQNKVLPEDLLSEINSYFKFGSPFHGQLIDSQLSKDGLSENRNAEILFEVSSNIKNTYCLKYGLSDIQCAKDLSNVKLSWTSLGEMCFSKYYNETACIGKNNLNYRSLDGYCNNLKHSFLGTAITPYNRLLFPAYIDGIREISEKLPNPRKLSTSLVNDKQSPDDRKSIAMAYWTIFIGHDISHTAIYKAGPSTTTLVNCCYNDTIVKNTLNKHIESCKPIMIPDDDTFFKSKSLKCMNYVRSMPVMRSDCTFGPMEQMNQVTHYLDGSMIYGLSEDQMWSLRTKSNGLLLTNTDSDNKNENHSIAYLPLEDTELNACQYGKNSCYRTGDIRVNAFPQLTIMHTLWVREHNRLAKVLSYYNKHWADERLFQEARKIVIASIQHITYTEWLPALLGENYTKHIGLKMLKKGFSNAYNETADPTVSNSFATAILPFANSMLSDNISLYSETRKIIGSLSLKKHYNRPIESVINYMDQLVRGLSTQSTQKVDMLFTETLTNYLYSTYPDNLFGMDIVSLAIQRSRDHGIPSYNEFRKYCGLKGIGNVQDLSQIMVKGSADRLMKQYNTWNDIDLLIGALSEKHAEDAMVGPTMRCIIRDQFIRTRTADRYFYDLPGIFNKDQLEQIRNVTLARVFCDNGNNVKTMQKQVFVKPASSYELLPCNSQLIPEINLFHWSELVDIIE